MIVISESLFSHRFITFSLQLTVAHIRMIVVKVVPQILYHKTCVCIKKKSYSCMHIF